LISSTRKMGVKIGPGWNSKACVRWLKIVRPRMSEGSVSGVHWSRWTARPSAFPMASASVVFPTPGTSSIRRCPFDRRQTTASSTADAGPR
jgi:hypothetical protein